MATVAPDVFLPPVLHTKITSEATFLVATGLSDRVRVARAVVLLSIKKTSGEYAVVINNLPLLWHI
jgi:hypothetical protein